MTPDQIKKRLADAGLQVKPLAFGEPDRNGTLYANFPISAQFQGYYNITQEKYDLASVEVGVVCHEFGGTEIWMGPKENAVAAANEHYDHRIYEALQEVVS